MSDTRQRTNQAAAGAAGATVLGVSSAGHTALARRHYQNARNSPGAKGSFSPAKARQVAPHLKAMQSELRAAKGTKIAAGVLAGAATVRGAQAVHAHRQLAKSEDSMTTSAFGVVHPEGVSKAAHHKKKQSAADRKRHPHGKPTTGRLAAGGLFPGAHGAIAGKKGHKLRAAGHEIGGSLIGGTVGLPTAGAVVGTSIAHDKGHYKKQHVKKSVFGVEHVGKALSPVKVGVASGVAGGAVEVGLRSKKKNAQTERNYFKREGAGQSYDMSTGTWKKPVSKSAFGVEHAHEVSKAELPNAIARGIKLPVTAGKGGSLRAAGQAVNPLTTAAKTPTGGSLAERLDAAKKAKGIAKSAFGVEHQMSKAEQSGRLTGGRAATVALAGPLHGAVAGKKGSKLRAAGNELGGSVVGSVAGTVAGAATRNRTAMRLGNDLGGRAGAVAGASRAQRRGQLKPAKS